jgi:methylthioribose-1-phosphate isomerase
VKVRNIAFDVTPAKYVTGIITEKGVFRPDDLHKLNEKDTDLESIMMKSKD